MTNIMKKPKRIPAFCNRKYPHRLQPWSLASLCNISGTWGKKEKSAHQTRKRNHHSFIFTQRPLSFGCATWSRSQCLYETHMLIGCSDRSIEGPLPFIHILSLPLDGQVLFFPVVWSGDILEALIWTLKMLINFHASSCQILTECQKKLLQALYEIAGIWWYSNASLTYNIVVGPHLWLLSLENKGLGMFTSTCPIFLPQPRHSLLGNIRTASYTLDGWLAQPKSVGSADIYGHLKDITAAHNLGVL